MFEKLIVEGEDYRLYQRDLDRNCIYLESTGLEFEASLGKAVIQIPLDVWNHIRRFCVVQLDLMNKTDFEIKEMVEIEVKTRVVTYKQSLENVVEKIPDPHPIYGSVSDKIKDQIERGTNYYTGERERQRQLHDSMVEQMKQTDPANEQSAASISEETHYVLSV